MATMIPSSVHDDCKSNAERRLFSRLKNELPDSYTVFHSLGIAKHNKKLVAEIDFVIVGNKGILCLEVKGGRISQKSGVWSYTDRYGKVHKKGESPFNQARTAMFGLIASIKSKFKVPSPQAGAAIGYAVVFPDAQFTVESPEWDLKKVIDCNGMIDNMEDVIGRHLDYSASEIRRAHNRTCHDLTDHQKSQLTAYLRPDFDLVRSLSSSIGESFESVLRLTNEQYEIFEDLNDNERIKVYGGAGTGKTLLAVEKARREAIGGKKVIYLCYNKLLANHVSTVLGDSPEGGTVEVTTLHDYGARIIKEAKMSHNLKVFDDQAVFTTGIPEVFGKAFVELYDRPPFDIVIVDEGQDLKSEAYIGMEVLMDAKLRESYEALGNGLEQY